MQEDASAGILAEGWVVADYINVTPSDVEPLGTVYIRARFVNQKKWLPAYAVLQILLDGELIWERSGVLGPGEEYTQPITHTLQSTMGTGIHTVTAIEEEQAAGIPSAEFTITSPAPPGQRNLSIDSIPQGADIYIGQALYGSSPITIPLIYGVYEITAIYGDQELKKNVQVVAGSGSQAVHFVFLQAQPIDWTKWITYGALGAAALTAVYLFIKKPKTVKRGYEKGKEYALKGYEKAKETYGVYRGTS